MGFLACKTIDESFLRLLDQDKLAHLLLLVLDRQILILNDLLSLKQLLLHCLVGTNLLLTLNNQRLDALFLVVDLRFMLDLERAQCDNFCFDDFALFFDGLRAEFKSINILQSTLILGLKVTVQRV